MLGQPWEGRAPGGGAFPSRPEGRLLLGRRLRLQGGAGPGPALRVPGWSRPAPAVQGRRHPRQRQVKSSGLLALLLFSCSLSLSSPRPLRLPPLRVGLFLRARVPGGRWAPAVQGLISNTCDCEVSFLVTELQIRQRLHGVSDKMSRISVHGRVAVLTMRRR